MIIKCDLSNIDHVFDYIGDDYKNCLYTYIDLKEYGLENENFNVWIQLHENEICCLISEYYEGIQIYSKDYNLIADELAEFIKRKNPGIISGRKKSIDKIKYLFPNYSEEIGIIGELEELTYPPSPNAYSASIDEIDEIAKIIHQDENLGKHHTYKSLYDQFYERKKDNFGRSFILRDSTSNNIICHAATYAELPELCVIGGVLTTPDYRGKGFSKGTLAAICKEMQLEGKKVFSRFNIPPAIKLHYGVGFIKVGDWVKLKKM